MDTENATHNVCSRTGVIARNLTESAAYALAYAEAKRTQDTVVVVDLERDEATAINPCDAE